MGLLDRISPSATRRSAIRHAIHGAIGGPAFVFALGNPTIRAEWPVLFPAFAVLGAGIAALAEWQLDAGYHKPSK